MRTVSAEEASEQIKENRSAIEAIEPSGSTPPVERQFNWTLPDGRTVEKTYVQDTLGMFPIQEFVTLVTEKLDEFTKGDMGARIGDLFRGEVETPVDLNADGVQGFLDDNMILVQAIIKLVRMAPELQLDILCLSLGVPRRERDWAKEQMQEPPSRGGLTVDEGFELLLTFLRQNADLLRKTLLGKARELVDVFRLEVLGHEIVDSTAEEETGPEISSSTTPSTSTMTPEDQRPTSPGGTPSSTSSQPTPENV